MRTLQDRVLECERRRPEVSRRDIATAAGVRAPSVSDWFNGKTASLKLRPAIGASRAWGCDALWLGEGIGLPQWADVIAPTATPDTAPAITLAAALEVVGIALAADMQPDQRAELAESMSAWVRYAGKERYRATVSELLAAPASPTQKRLAAG